MRCLFGFLVGFRLVFGGFCLDYLVDIITWFVLVIVFSVGL